MTGYRLREGYRIPRRISDTSKDLRRCRKILNLRAGSNLILERTMQMGS